MDRIRKMMKRGCSILFVSHDMEAVKSLCDRTVYLENGKLVRMGAPEEVVNLYHGIITKTENQTHELETIESDPSVVVSDHILKEQDVLEKFVINPKLDSLDSEDRYGDRKVLIRNVQILNEDEKEVDTIGFLDKVILRYHIEFNIQTDQYNIGFLCRNVNGINIFGARTKELLEEVPLKKKGDKAIVDFVFTNRLNSGVYTISAAVSDQNKVLLPDYHDWINNVVVFKSESPPNTIWGLLYQEMESISIS